MCIVRELFLEFVCVWGWTFSILLCAYQHMYEFANTQWNVNLTNTIHLFAVSTDSAIGCACT